MNVVGHAASVFAVSQLAGAVFFTMLALQDLFGVLEIDGGWLTLWYGVGVVYLGGFGLAAVLHHRSRRNRNPSEPPGR